MLTLLATVAVGLGARGLSDYEPPARRFRDAYAPAVVRPVDRAARFAQIAAAAQALGGEAS